MKSLIKRLILEDIKNFGEIYHISGLDNIKDILKNNSINLSLGLGADKYSKKFFFLSLSRTPSVNIGYKAGSFSSRIVFDKNKLFSNFSKIPVDYWGLKGSKGSEWSKSNFEYEDRLLSDKPSIDNINKYIKRIEIGIREDSINNINYVNTLKEIINLGKLRNIDIYFYKSSNDFRLGKNRIDSNQIMNISLSKEDEYNSYSYPERYENIIAIMMYDDKYIDNYDLFVKDLNVFLGRIGLTENDIKDAYSIYDRIKSLSFNSFRSDVMTGLSSDLRNYFKSGKGGKYREVVGKFINQMKKLGVRSIEEFINLKVSKIKPKGEKINYSKNWGLYELGYNYDTSEYDTWESLSNEIKLEKIRIYFNTYNYGGYLSKEDMDFFFDLRDKNGTIGQFLNYLMNKYTLDKVKEIVYKSGYDDVYKRYSFKLDKLN